MKKMGGKIFCLLFCGVLINSDIVMSEYCGGNYTDRYGVIQFPDDNKQHPYDGEVECWWIIVANESDVISLTINISESVKCSDGFINVFDGNVWILTVCDYSPPPVVTKGSIIMIHFYTNNATGKSISLSYAHSLRSLCGSQEYMVVANINSYDGDGDGLYDHNLDCHWVINIVGEKPNLTGLFYITRMDIQRSDNCESDYLEIAEETYYVGLYCGKTRLPVYSMKTRSLNVRFHSDDSINGRGFSAVYVTSDGVCGRIMTRTEGNIESIDRDKDGVYDANMNCWWILVAPEGSIVDLYIFDYNIEYHALCEKDYLMFYDGEPTPEGYFGIICGKSDSLQVPPTSTNVLYLQFYTDDTGSGTGFNLSYRHMKESENTTNGFSRTTTISAAQEETSSGGLMVNPTSFLGTKISTGPMFSQGLNMSVFRSVPSSDGAPSSSERKRASFYTLTNGLLLFFLFASVLSITESPIY